MEAWTKTYEGKHVRETWTHASGRLRVSDRSAAWGYTPRRPFSITQKTPSGHWTAVPGRRYFATAQSAMRAADKLLAKAAD